jgi:16S rRNA (uracil1498-N3)-methyltransferase
MYNTEKVFNNTRDSRLRGKNIPRIFINENLEIGKQISASKEITHYLTRVMRTDECLVFNNGAEYVAKIINNQLSVISLTEHPDPCNNITLCFAPIKKTDDLINMATQMGVKKLQPVITDRTVAHHINWDRMRKIIIEAAEQSNRNSIPELLPPMKFSQMCNLQSAKCNLIFGDERMAYNQIDTNCTLRFANCTLLIGPEGGFSDAEFAALDASNAIGVSLGKTILRAEVAAVALLAKAV